MIKIVLYYWLLIAAVWLLAKFAGLAENTNVLIQLLIGVTALYIGAVLVRSKGKTKGNKQQK